MTILFETATDDEIREVTRHLRSPGIDLVSMSLMTAPGGHGSIMAEVWVNEPGEPVYRYCPVYCPLPDLDVDDGTESPIDRLGPPLTISISGPIPFTPDELEKLSLRGINLVSDYPIPLRPTSMIGTIARLIRTKLLRSRTKPSV